jgi:MOSC domain-containing protein
MPTLVRITVFPIKSLDGCDVDTATVLPSGALLHDRRYALVDAWGRFVNGKRCQAIHAIRAKYSDDFRQVSLDHGGQRATFSLASEQQDVARWCGAALGKTCRLVENAELGFPDDCEAPGPTVLSTATLATVASWFALPLEETRRRFRANLEIDADEPFWEDRLVGERTKVRRFAIGGTVWQGRGICQRCVVPSRDSHSGAVTGGFARQFSERREASLPDWSPAYRFDHFYRLAINTGLDSAAGESIIRVGDAVTALEDPRLASRP